MSKRAVIVVALQNEYFTSGKLPLVNIDQAAAKAAQVHATAMAALGFAYASVQSTRDYL